MTIELRDSGSSAWQFSGWATTWSRHGSYFVSEPGVGVFREEIARGAFADAVAGREDVELRREHRADGPVFARTSAGSLHFEDMDPGLLLVGALSKSDRATWTAVEDIRAGRLTGLSVGMAVREESWGKWSDGRTELRTISRAGLAEVSIVQRPANPQATVSDVRHEHRSDRPRVEYRFVPFSARQEEDEAECPNCGTEVEEDMTFCPSCGTRLDDGDAVDFEGRRDFTVKELAQLGKRGLAVYIDGHWAYPTPTRADFDNAIRTVGRTPGRNRATVRKYLMRRARKEGWPVPDSWNGDGSIKRSSAPSFTEIEAMLELSRLG